MKKAIYGSLLLSVLHSILFYGQDLGISVVLFAIPTVLFAIEVLKQNDKIKNKKALFLSIPIILLSSTYFIFNNEVFNVVNMIAIPVLFAIMVIWSSTDIFKIKFLFGRAFNLIIGSLEFIPNALKEVKTNIKQNKEKEESSKNKVAKQIGIGILCSLPILLIILGLLISADGIFAKIFGDMFDKIMYIFSSEIIMSLISRLIVIILIFVYIMCIIYNLINKNSAYNVEIKESKQRINIEGIIVNTVLTVINVIYLIFSVVQFLYVYSYIFDETKIAYNFNFASYARQGFFQLMVVSLINFAIIIITNLNKKEMTQNIKKYTKLMNILMAVFTIIIAISAFLRMNLYQREYGYTFLRLMVDFILVTEIIMIIPTIVYILKEKIQIYKWYIIIGISMYVVVNFANIDYIIAKNNVEKYLVEVNEKEKEIDFTYLKYNTSTDAIPEIAKLLDNTEDMNLKRKVNNYLFDEYSDLKEKRNIQEFNISKQRATKLLEKLDLKYEQVTNYNLYNSTDYYRNYNKSRKGNI